LSELKIILQDRTVYSGRAVISNVVNLSALVLCEATLDDSCWLDAGPLSSAHPGDSVQVGFEEFLHGWQRNYKVSPEFKVVVADMQTFLTDLRLWLEQIEFGVRSSPSADRVEMERKISQELGPTIVPAFDALHERLEEIGARIEEDLRPAHRNFTKRQLHPLMLCSPFAYRTFQKPLGYAGDYEMVNMIIRDPHEGSSLYAKIVNLWFLSQWPAEAHRNRINYLKRKLVEETARFAWQGKSARIFNLGCGPAGEIQAFLKEERISDNAKFTLLDFNEETIQHTSHLLESIRKGSGRNTSIHIQKKSVSQIIKEGAKPITDSPDREFDFIYCAGLFDYLSDRVCKQLMNIFYNWLAPGGLLVATNVDANQPFRTMLEFILDWHLIYRDATRCSALVPDQAPPGAYNLKGDETGVNMIIEVRKPANGQ